MHRSPRLLALAPLLALSVGCSSGDPAAVSRAAQPIADGVDDTVHRNVVGIAIQTSRRGGGICTGSLIAPNLVLTARHCVSPVSGSALVCSRVTAGGVTYQPTVAQAPYDPTSFGVTTDPQITGFSPFTRVAEVIIPDGTTGGNLCGHDIALLRLASPITTVAPIKPRLDIAPEAREGFSATGYGATDGDGNGAGRRRMRDRLLVEYVGFAQALGGVTVLEDSEWIGDEGTCQGDSGGPALDELGEVIGVLSRGEANSCVRPVYTRVDAFSEWIRAQAARAATLGGYTAPSWVAPPATRSGGQGDGCDAQSQCGPALVCKPTGHGRECTADRCDACPSGWICTSDEVTDRCVRDPSVPIAPPAPEVDAGAPTPESDAGTTPAPESDAGTTPSTETTATESGGCSATPTRASGGWSVIGLAALALASRRRRLRG
ncbi:MAG: trypsin-like serine protease [Polyangiales bacterium]